MAPQGMSMYARGYRNVAGIEQHSAANTALTFAQNSPAFNSISASPAFGLSRLYAPLFRRDAPLCRVLIIRLDLSS
jgi:hypothetical protein